MTDNEKINWQGWETVGLIGGGSFGDVYEIKREVFDDTEKAALKIISIPQNSKDIEEMYNDGYDEESVTGAFESHLKSILAEYTLMRKMSDCVNIVRCDDVNYEHHEDGIGWNIFIRMELLTPLTRALPVAIPEETVIKLAKDICNALDCCKKYNVIHRDIKPQNIFVSENGDYKLGDFGIAKTVEKTMGGTKIGTYKYMAPEVYNNQPYGTAADIYSLGLVLYWMLNNRRMPFVSANSSKMTVGIEEESRNRRLSGEKLPEPATGSKELKAIVMKACAYNPKDRYSSAKEMLNALNELGKEVSKMVTAPIIDSNPSELIDKYTLEGEDTELNESFVIPSKTEENSFDLVSNEKVKKDKPQKPLIITICAIVLVVLIFIGAIVIDDNDNSGLNEDVGNNIEDQYDNGQYETPQDDDLHTDDIYSGNEEDVSLEENWFNENDDDYVESETNNSEDNAIDEIDKKAITVTYDTGDKKMSGTQYVGDTYKNLPKPEKSGYKFLEWYYNGQVITNETIVEVETDHTLTAEWEPIKYYVKYNANGGTSASMSNTIHTYNMEKALSKNRYRRTGYEFLGWSKSSIATSATYKDEEIIKNLTTTNGATVNLYAVWQSKSVGRMTMSVDKNTYNVGDIVTLSFKLSEETKLGTLTFDVLYDSDMLEYYEANMTISGQFNPRYSLDKARFTTAAQDTISTSKTILYIKFKAKKAGTVKFDVEIDEASDVDYNEVVISTNSVTVSVKSTKAVVKNDAVSYEFLDDKTAILWGNQKKYKKG